MNIQSALVLTILERAHVFDWTVQGFGMLRTKIKDVGRIHIWDSRLRTPLVSDVHAHPWPLKSTIISGELINVRYKEIEWDGEAAQIDAVMGHSSAMRFCRSAIKTGEGGGLTGPVETVFIRPEPPEVYLPGKVYEQRPDEVHRSMPIDGTITLLERPMGEPLQETTVYWPVGCDWISAEPRPATRDEIKAALRMALARWAPI